MGRSKKKQKPFKKKQGCAAITKARDNVFLKNQRQGNAKSLVDDFECLCNQLDTFGLTIRVVPKDGNCLFRSVADQLFGLASNGPDFDEEPHIVLRKNTVRYLEAHEKQFAPFIEDDTSFHEYCETYAKRVSVCTMSKSVFSLSLSSQSVKRCHLVSECSSWGLGAVSLSFMLYRFCTRWVCECHSNTGLF